MLNTGHVDKTELLKQYAAALVAAHKETDATKKVRLLADAQGLNRMVGIDTLQTDLDHTRRIVQAVEVLKSDKKNSASKRLAEAEGEYREHLLTRIRKGVEYVAGGSVKELEKAVVDIEQLIRSNPHKLVNTNGDGVSYFKKISADTATIRTKHNQAVEDAKRVKHANEVLERAEGSKQYIHIKNTVEKGK